MLAYYETGISPASFWSSALREHYIPPNWFASKKKTLEPHSRFGNKCLGNRDHDEQSILWPYVVENDRRKKKKKRCIIVVDVGQLLS